MTFWPWLRRSLSVWVLPIVIGIAVVGAVQNGEWVAEWQASFRHLVYTMPLVTPLLAGAVGFDVASLWQPLHRGLGRSLLDGQRALPQFAVVGVLVGLLGYTVAGGLLVWRMTQRDSFGAVDGMLAMETAAALFAAAGVGLVAGSRLSVWVAPPVAAAVIYGSYVLLGGAGIGMPFFPPTVQGSLMGLTPLITAAMWAVLQNLLIGLLGVALALLPSSGGTRRVAWAAGSVVVATAVVLTGIQNQKAVLDRGAFVPDGSSQICVGEQPVVCGPGSANRFVQNVSRQMGGAYTALRESSLPLPKRFVLLRPGDFPDPVATDAASFVTPYFLQSKPTPALAQLLASPRVCEVFYTGGPELEPLSRSYETVRAWLTDRLGSGATGPAPEAVKTAYQKLTTCTATP